MSCTRLRRRSTWPFSARLNWMDMVKAAARLRTAARRCTLSAGSHRTWLHGRRSSRSSKWRPKCNKTGTSMHIDKMDEDSLSISRLSLSIHLLCSILTYCTSNVRVHSIIVRLMATTNDNIWTQRTCDGSVRDAGRAGGCLLFTSSFCERRGWPRTTRTDGRVPIILTYDGFFPLTWH